MSVRHLETALSTLPKRAFPFPRIDLEQYTTSPHIAARVAHAALNLGCCEWSPEWTTVADLGTGTGVLSIAMALLGCKYVLGVDADVEALSLARENVEAKVLEGDLPAGRVELMCADVHRDAEVLRPKSFDMVVMNPPFGTRVKSADVGFLDVACDVARYVVYSLHKRSTRDFIVRRMDRAGFQVEVVAEVRFDLPPTYRFHKQRSADVEVDLLEIRLC